MKEKKNRIRIWIGRAAFVLATFAAAALIYFGLDYVISDDTSSLSRVTILNFYKEDPVDFVFIGTSHTLYCVDAVHMTEKLDRSVYNLSTSGPDFVDLYYLLKEAIRAKDIDTAFVEMSLSRFGYLGDNETATFIISDYLKNFPNRAALIMDAADEDSYMNGFFRLRRNLSQLPTVSEIKWLYNRKQEEQYTRYSGWEQYRGRGEWYRHGTFDRTIDYDGVDNYSEQEFIPKEWEYLTKIMDLCRRKGVRLVLYVTPYSAPYLIQYSEYEQVMDTVRKLAAEHSATLIDLNLVRDEYFHADPEDYTDFEHMNTEVGERLADFFAAYIRDPDHDWFHGSLREKYPDDTVYGVGYRKSFVTDQGIFGKSTEAKGTIREMRLSIEPFSFHDVDADILLTELAHDEETDTWSDVCTFRPTGREGSLSEFAVPYDPKVRVYYRIEVFRSGTDELLFETESFFREWSEDER